MPGSFKPSSDYGGGDFGGGGFGGGDEKPSRDDDNKCRKYVCLSLFLLRADLLAAVPMITLLACAPSLVRVWLASIVARRSEYTPM